MKDEIFIMLTPKKIFLLTSNDKTELQLKEAIEPYRELLRKLVFILDEIRVKK